MDKIEDILNRKMNGQDCTEDESAELKGFIKKNINSENEDKLFCILVIIDLFPIEYGEALTEMESE